MRSITLGMVLTLALAACTSGSEGEARKAAPPRVGGTITLAAATPNSLDPSKASSRSALLVLKQICDPLVAAAPLSGALEPGAAESWTVSPDARKVTFKLRPGVKFHNGREVTAQDYAYSLSRFVDRQIGSSLHFLLDRVVGYRDMREGRALTLAGVKAPDPTTLEVELSEPFAELPAVMSHPAAGSAIPKEEVDKNAEAFAAKPLCTGPYALAQPWAPGQDINLARAGTYLAKSPVYSRGGAGYADRMVLKVLADAQGRPDLESGYRQLTQAQVQIAEVPVGQLAQARKVAGRVETAPNGRIEYVGFPTTKPPFDNANFRRALALSIDRSDIVAGLLGGSRTMPSGFLPPTAGPLAERSTCKQGVKPRPDPRAARSALKASGIDPAATKLTIYFNDSGSGHDKWLSRVAKQWKSTLGLESTLRPDAWRKFLDLLAEPGPDGPFSLAWAVEYPSPEAMFGPLFQGGSLDNYMRYKSQEFDDALKQARSAVDPQARSNAYLRAAEILCRDLPIAPMWFGTAHLGFDPELRSAARSRVDIAGDPLLRELGRAR